MLDSNTFTGEADGFSKCHRFLQRLDWSAFAILGLTYTSPTHNQPHPWGFHFLHLLDRQYCVAVNNASSREINSGRDCCA